MHKFNNEDPLEEKPIDVIRDLFTLFGEIESLEYLGQKRQSIKKDNV